jgi:hypothetical protein
VQLQQRRVVLRTLRGPLLWGMKCRRAELGSKVWQQVIAFEPMLQLQQMCRGLQRALSAVAAAVGMSGLCPYVAYGVHSSQPVTTPNWLTN